MRRILAPTLSHTPILPAMAAAATPTDPNQEPAPTLAQYQALQRAYDHFNAALFGGQLPPCLITLRSSHRHHGYHHEARFVNLRGQTVAELGLHPGFFTLRAPEETLSTLVHEMVHHWQAHFSQPSKGNPHNREWAAKMRSLGLEPSSTGLPGGKDGGHSVSHYIRPEGAFLRACRELLGQGFALPWFDRHVPTTPETQAQHRQALAEAGVALELADPPVAVLQTLPVEDASTSLIPPAPKRASDRVRYHCPGCGIKAWAAPQTQLLCGSCEQPLQEA